MARWEEKSNEKVHPGVVEFVIGAIVPGQPVAQPRFESTYIDGDTGRTVTGSGETPEEARDDAREKI